MLIRRRRPDARAFDQIRQITCEVGVLPRVHGSALFTRGETQALATATLGTKEDMQRLDLLFEEDVVQALHAALQLPAVFGGRSEVPARPGPARNRPRRAGRARADEPASARSGFPVRDARGFRHSRIERLVVDGHGLRRFARADGCGRAAEVSVRGYRHGPGGRRRQVRHPHRHRRRGRSLRRHGLQGCRHAAGNHRAADGHQGRRRQHQHDARGAGAGQEGAPADSRHHGPDALHRRARTFPPTRRACTCSTSPPTRFAT